jgi:hypothetical protein
MNNTETVRLARLTACQMVAATLSNDQAMLDQAATLAETNHVPTDELLNVLTGWTASEILHNTTEDRDTALRYVQHQIVTLEGSAA